MIRPRRFPRDSDGVMRCFYCKEVIHSDEDLVNHRSCELKLKENPVAGNQQDDEFPSCPDPDQQV